MRPWLPWYEIYCEECHDTELCPSFTNSFLDSSESSEIKPPLKKSKEQCLKVRENLAKKVFLSDSTNDLEDLLILDIEKLIEKYEEISRSKNLVTIQDLENNLENNHLVKMKIERITEQILPD